MNRYLAERFALLLLALLLAALAIDAGLTIDKDFEQRQREVSRGSSIDVDLDDGEKLLVWTSSQNGCISWEYNAKDGGITALEDECSDAWVESMDMTLLGAIYGGCDCTVEADELLILTEETHEMLHRTQTRPLQATVMYSVLSCIAIYFSLIHKRDTNGS